MFYICGKYKNRFLMKTVKLITCNDAMKAHILQGALENEGIESILHNENFSTLYKSCVSSIARTVRTSASIPLMSITRKL